MDLTEDSPQPGEWVSLKQAAAVLELSEKTVRRRIEQGTYKGRQVSSRYGPSWQVWVDVPESKSTVDSESTLRGESQTNLELIKLVRDLQENNTQNAATAAMWQARAEMLSFQLQQAQQTIKALEAPKHQSTLMPGQSESFQEEPETAENREVVADAIAEHQQPWWRRFWQLVSV